MIDFKHLLLTVDKFYSFVGIQKEGNLLYFYLPKGFNNEIDKIVTFNKNKDLFFSFYKIFDTFKRICIDKGYLDKSEELTKKERDGVIISDKGSGIQDDGDNSENVFYSKLDIIGSLLDAYDEPKILSLAYRLGKSDRFDVSEIHKYLHQAIYLPNNAAYVDQMLLPKKLVQFESTDIVAMYCYLFCEVKQQLKEIVNGEIEALAERFKEKYLRHSDSIFDEESYEQVLDILKNTLETIDHHTPIKDGDYWQYYEAIESFIYGDLNKEEDGEIWGVSNFHSVWESMCLKYIAQYTSLPYLLHLDFQYVSSAILEVFESCTKSIDISNVLNINNAKLIPDAIIQRVFLLQPQEKKTYSISAMNWNDNNYYTAIDGIDIPIFKNRKIMPRLTYIDQEPLFLMTKHHPIRELKQIYQNIDTKTVLIDSPLPKNFYSFWEIPKDIDIDFFHKMYYFNHLFFLALEKDIRDADRFFDEIILPLGTNNALTESLLRGYQNPRDRNTDRTKLKHIFSDFISQLEEKYGMLTVKRIFAEFSQSSQVGNKDIIEIIDVKYLDFNYFLDSSKIEDIKKTSVRKQFVYEYLLQKDLEKRKDKFSNLNIHSSFWLPSYRPDDPNLIEDGETFIDSYIQLKNINFAVLAENYIA
jgi:hypothetical protein